MNVPTFSIRDRRKELKLTLENVGQYVGVSKGTVSKWEKGKIKNMRSDKISLLAHVLQVSVTDILSVCQNGHELIDNSFDEPDEDDPNYVHPEDKAERKRNRLCDSLNNYADEDEAFPYLGKAVRLHPYEIAYCNENGDPVRQEFSKEEFDFVMSTIRMLKSKTGTK